MGNEEGLIWLPSIPKRQNYAFLRGAAADVSDWVHRNARSRLDYFETRISPYPMIGLLLNLLGGVSYEELYLQDLHMRIAFLVRALRSSRPH